MIKDLPRPGPRKQRPLEEGSGHHRERSLGRYAQIPLLPPSSPPAGWVHHQAHQPGRDPGLDHEIDSLMPQVASREGRDRSAPAKAGVGPLFSGTFGELVFPCALAPHDLRLAVLESLPIGTFLPGGTLSSVIISRNSC